MTITSRRDLAHLLARAHRAIEAPTRLADENRAALLDALAKAETHIAGPDVPWPIEIHVGTIAHRHGVDTYVALSRTDLTAKIAAFCRKYWSEINNPRDPDTLDDDTVASAYFGRRSDEYLETDRIEVAPTLTALAAELVETGWYCVLGTAHLSNATADLLDQWCSENAPNRPVNIASSIYGWFVPTRKVDPVTQGELPEDLLAAMNFARERGFDHILFDCDAGTVETLPVHSW